MSVICIDINLPGYKRIAAIDGLLGELGDEDRLRALALFFRLETYTWRLHNEQEILDHVTDETASLFFDETSLLKGLFKCHYGENGKKKWENFSKVYFDQAQLFEPA